MYRIFEYEVATSSHKRCVHRLKFAACRICFFNSSGDKKATVYEVQGYLSIFYIFMTIILY